MDCGGFERRPDRPARAAPRHAGARRGLADGRVRRRDPDRARQRGRAQDGRQSLRALARRRGRGARHTRLQADRLSRRLGVEQRRVDPLRSVEAARVRVQGRLRAVRRGQEARGRPRAPDARSRRSHRGLLRDAPGPHGGRAPRHDGRPERSPAQGPRRRLQGRWPRPGEGGRELRRGDQLRRQPRGTAR